MAQLHDTYATLQQAVADVETDLQKAAGGNKAAGTRVRKSMQEIKNIAQELRKQVLEVRDDSGA
ncbi:MAG: histone H1 [Planctomycetota bacterium]